MNASQWVASSRDLLRMQCFDVVSRRSDWIAGVYRENPEGGQQKTNAYRTGFIDPVFHLVSPLGVFSCPSLRGFP